MISKFKLSAAIAAAGFLAVTLPVSAEPSTGTAALKAAGLQQSLVERTDLFNWRKGRCYRGIGGRYKWVKGVGKIQCTSAKCYTNIFGYKVCDYF